MYAYNKTIKICLAEYFIVLLLHVIYAFFHSGDDIGRVVLLVSFLSFSITTIIAISVKNEKVVVAAIFISVILATSIIGSLLDTLAYSIYIYLLMSVLISVFMEARYVLYSGIASLVAVGIYLIFLPEEILNSVDSYLIYGFYILIYIAGFLNLMFLTSQGKKYRKAFEDKAEEAKAANESKLLFLANMSHEIRTPMNAICGITELTLKEELSQEVRNNVESIQTASKNLVTIVNDILDYSKLESGNIEIVPVTYSFSKLIEDTALMMKSRVLDKEVELKVDIEPTIPDSLIGDETRIGQIIYNLLSNAIKFTEKGYIILKVTGSIDQAKEKVDLVFSVTDSGVGIRKDDLPKLFTSFQQLDSRKSRSQEGTGLGLAICKKLVTMMGGDISCESAYGVGSKFTFNISQKIAEGKVLSYSDVTASKDVPKVVAPEGKVLVVDDNAVNLKVAEGLLKSFSLKVDTCMSGRACLEILKDTKDYDIIFIDHMMPELDGIDTLNLIRSEQNDYMRNVPLIALTANVVSGIRDMFISEGFNDYVPKPIDMVWLNSILHKYLPLDKQR